MIAQDRAAAVVRRALTRAPSDAAAVQVVRYLIVAGTGYLLAMATYVAEIASGVPPYPAVAVVFVLNGLWNFVGVRRWAFPASGRAPQVDLLRFGVVAALSLAVNYCAFGLLYSVAGLLPEAAQALAVIIAAPVGFLANKFWSFRGGAGQPSDS